MKGSQAKNEKLSHSLIWHLIPALFIVCMILIYPFRYRFEFDHDEGINAIKAMLSIQGYPLYSETWSDQPPIFTLMLRLWFQIFGQTVLVGRGLVLLISAGLLWLVIQYLQQSYGNLHAAIGIALMLFLPNYLRLSVSIMIGLPAIALALLSFFCLAQWHKHNNSIWLVISASALGFSIMTKLFTGFLAPIFFSGIAMSGLVQYREHKDLLGVFKPALLWLATLTVTTGAILVFVVKPQYIYQMLQIHLTAATSTPFSEHRELKLLNFFLELLGAFPILILALLSTISTYRSRSWTAGYLVAWVFVGAILLLINTPFWYHQQLLITVPGVILAAIALGNGLISLREAIQTKNLGLTYSSPGLITYILALTFVTARISPTLEELDFKLPNLRALSTEDFAEYQIVATMWNYAEHTRWIYTDRQMFAFRTQLPVPPYLAVMSRKRIAAGALTEDQIGDILVEYQPELIFQERLDLPIVKEFISKRNYQRVDSTYKYRLFVSDDVLQISRDHHDADSQE